MIAAVPEGAGPYLALAILTFALHALAIGFVVAGTAVVALAAARGRADAPIAAATRDWLPFALGLGITAGVAPLLFVQLLYQPRFYTANLLLFVRWLAIVPALIVGFYALYLARPRGSTPGRVGGGPPSIWSPWWASSSSAGRGSRTTPWPWRRRPPGPRSTRPRACATPTRRSRPGWCCGWARRRRCGRPGSW
jgi:hypothetical protein